jgi:hypothetical protein
MPEVYRPDAVALRRSVQAEEYGQFVATGPIDLDGVRAFNTGDPVPAGHVKKFNLDKAGMVTSVNADTPAAKPATKKEG